MIITNDNVLFDFWLQTKRTRSSSTFRTVFFHQMMLAKQDFLFPYHLLDVDELCQSSSSLVVDNDIDAVNICQAGELTKDYPLTMKDGNSHFHY